MKDITKRLRAFKTGCDRKDCERMVFTPLVCEEAADEIERLREALKKIADSQVEINAAGAWSYCVFVAQAALQQKETT